MITLPDLPKIPKVGEGLGAAVKNIQKPSQSSNQIKRVENAAANRLRESTSPMVNSATDRFGQEPVKNIVAANRPKNKTPSGLYGKIKQKAETAKTLEQRRVNPPKPSIL